MSTNTNTDKSFRYAMLCLIVFLAFIGFSIIVQLRNIYGVSAIFGVLVLLMSFFGIIGFTYSLKSWKEPSNYKKWIGILVNVLVVIGFIALLIANFLDIQRAL